MVVANFSSRYSDISESSSNKSVAASSTHSSPSVCCVSSECCLEKVSVSSVAAFQPFSELSAAHYVIPMDFHLDNSDSVTGKPLNASS